MSTVIFTGAGASKPFGYPTTTEFFDSPFLESLEPRRMSDIFYNAKRELGNPEPVDVENLLQLLDPIETFISTRPGKFLASQVKEDWSRKIPRLVQMIKDRCFDLYAPLEGMEEQAVKLYGPLFEACGWPYSSIPFFTTNYDPVTDGIMELAEKKYLSAYDGFSSRGYWTPAGYDNSKPGVRIYRLHGSTAWIDENSRVKNGRTYAQMRGRKHVLLYPGFKGDPETELYDVFKYPHEQLREQLGTALKLIVIGFSFRDPHLNTIFEDALRTNTALELLLINPERPTAEQSGFDKLEELAKDRVFYQPYRLEDPATVGEVEKFVKAPGGSYTPVVMKRSTAKL